MVLPSPRVIPPAPPLGGKITYKKKNTDVKNLVARNILDELDEIFRDIENNKVYLIDLSMYNDFVEKIRCIKDGIEDLNINTPLDSTKKLLYAELYAEYHFYITYKFKEKALDFYIDEIEEEIAKVLSSDNILNSAEQLIEKLQEIKVLRGTDFIKEKILELRYIILKHDDTYLYYIPLLQELKPLFIKEALMLISDETINFDKREELKNFLKFSDLNDIVILREAYEMLFKLEKEKLKSEPIRNRK